MSNCFDVLMDKVLGADRISGCNILVIKDGQERFFGSYGLADRAKNMPMKRDTVFRLFSMSKPVTAAAVMLLVDRGIIDLADNVEWYLPGFANGKVAVMDEPAEDGDARGKKYHLEPVHRGVTLADLMTMTSGVSYPGIEDASHIEVDECLKIWEKKMRENDYPSTVDFANALGKCPLAFQPGERWMYGFSADILGAVVEVASGRRFGDFLRDEIFVPLGMFNTSFDLNADMRSRLAEVYEDDPDNAGHIRAFRGMNLGLGDFPDRAVFESGGAGLISTIDDYSKFAMMLAGEGEYKGIRILSKSAVKYMHTNALKPDIKQRDMNWGSTEGHGYNCLMRILEDPTVQRINAPAGEFGWDGWLGTYFTVEPETKSVILFFRQKTNTGTDDITRKVRAIAYGNYLN